MLAFPCASPLPPRHRALRGRTSSWRVRSSAFSRDARTVGEIFSREDFGIISPNVPLSSSATPRRRLLSRGEGEERGRGGGPDSLPAVHAQPDPEGGEPRVAPGVVLHSVAAEVETHENHHAGGGGGVLAAVRNSGVRVVLRVRALAGLQSLDHRGGRDEGVFRLHRGVSGVGALHRVRPVHRSVFSPGQRARRDPAPRRRAVHPRVHVLRAGGAVDVRLGEDDI